MEGSDAGSGPARELHVGEAVRRPRAVIMNADDWGRDAATSDRCLDCILNRAVSSVSAMVFMADSERAASLALEHGVDAGLHLNFTLRYSARQCPPRLMEQQEKVARFLSSGRLAPVFFHPGLAASFEYVVKAQQEEYERLYGVRAKRLDGHHHMHLCANVVFQNLMPSGAIVRRNLSFKAGEKSHLNRLYRGLQDRWLARRHPLADYLFDMQILNQQHQWARIQELAAHFDVEVETHPIRDEEYGFLLSEEFARLADRVAVARGYSLQSRASGIHVRGEG